MAYRIYSGNDNSETAAFVLRDLGREGYIVAVDFDGTLCHNNWPHIGVPDETNIELLKIVQSFGINTILWTCREGIHLQAAKDWLDAHGIHFDAYNENLPREIAKWHSDPRKIGADEFWDDKNICLLSKI